MSFINFVSLIPIMLHLTPIYTLASFIFSPFIYLLNSDAFSSFLIFAYPTTVEFLFSKLFIIMTQSPQLAIDNFY